MSAKSPSELPFLELSVMREAWGQSYDRSMAGWIPCYLCKSTKVDEPLLVSIFLVGVCAGENV